MSPLATSRTVRLPFDAPPSLACIRAICTAYYVLSARVSSEVFEQESSADSSLVAAASGAFMVMSGPGSIRGPTSMGMVVCVAQVRSVLGEAYAETLESK